MPHQPFLYNIGIIGECHLRSLKVQFCQNLGYFVLKDFVSPHNRRAAW